MRREKIQSSHDAKPNPIEVVCRYMRQWVNRKTFDYLQSRSCSQSEENDEKLDTIQDKLSDLQLTDSIPDEIKQESNENESKVNAFLAGKLEYPVYEVRKDTVQVQTTQVTNSYREDIFLPLADSVSQKALRRKIVTENIMNQKG